MLHRLNYSVIIIDGAFLKAVLFFFLFLNQNLFSTDKKPLPTTQEPEAKTITSSENTSPFLICSADGNIQISCSLPLSGGASLLASDINLGFNLVFNKINQSGGILKKHLVKYISADDNYEASRTHRNITELYPKTHLCISPFGADALSALEPEISTSRLTVLFPFGSPQSIISQEYKNLICGRQSIKSEINLLLQYAIDKSLKHKVAVFYEDSLFGQHGLKCAEAYCESIGMKISAKAYYQKNTLSIMPAVKKIAAESPDTILCIAQSYPAYNFIQQIINDGRSSCLFLGTSELSLIQPILARARGIKMVTSCLTPQLNQDIEIIKQYKSDMAKDYPNKTLSQISLESYIYAKILIDSLEEVLLKDQKSATLDTLTEHIKKYDKTFFGLPIKFDKKTQSLFSTVSILEKGIE